MNQPIPKVLYKYRDDSALTEDVFKNKQVWLSVASKLNDPLECRTGTIPEEWQSKTILEMEKAQLMGVISSPPKFLPPQTLFSLSPRDTKRWIKRLLELSHERRIKAMRALYAQHGVELSEPQKIFKELDRQLATVGIFSVTERPDNELMWSHYAQGHSGLALGFSRVAGSKFNDARHTLPVTYANQKPVFETGFMQEVSVFAGANGNRISKTKFSFEDPVFRAAFSTKPVTWSYEEEWRYIEESAGLHPWPGQLRQVVFGLRMRQDRRDLYRQLAIAAAGSEVEFYEIAVEADASAYVVRKL